MIIIFLIILALAGANFAPASWLSGWDNLHPEFNFGLNIARSLFAVWQEYQGLGLLGGMAHAADLPHQLLLLSLSSVFPAMWLRQLYFFLTLALGSLGMYFLLERAILRRLSPTERKLGSLAGAAFYLLNLATVQTFYIPFEAFITHFAFLPWLFLALILYLYRPNVRSFLIFIGVNFFAVPQSYVPTLFVVYFLSMLIFLLIMVLKSPAWQFFRRAAGAVVLTLAINAFWLLPFIYFLFNGSAVTIEAKINQMATEKVYLQNKEFGDFTDVALLKGFWFNNLDFGLDRQLAYMLGPWRVHLADPLISGIGYFLFAIILAGIVWAFRRKNHYLEFLLVIFLLSVTILTNNTPPFSWANEFLRQKVPLFAQVFRFPFTKFSILAAFSYAIFFAFGVSWILAGLKKLRHRVLAQEFSMFVLIGLLVIFTLPAFKGNLIYNRLKIPYPQEYTKLWSFFKDQKPGGRIANFPQHTFWGWDFYRFGYDGSGFLWYNLNQPILDRAFDVWSRENEDYYWEVSYAIYSKNPALLEQVLNKYRVSWLVLDENVIYPSSTRSLYLDEIKDMVGKSGQIRSAADFGRIKIYQVIPKPAENSSVYLGQNLPLIGPAYKWGNFDRAYSDYGDYIKSAAGSDIFYPFRTLFSGKEQSDLEFVVEDKGDFFVFKRTIPDSMGDYRLQIPQVDSNELLWVDPKDLSKSRFLKPDVSLNDHLLEAKVPKAGGYFSAIIDPSTDPSVQTAKNCSQLESGEVKNGIGQDGEKKFLRLESLGTTNCSASFWLPNLDYKFSYLISAETRNIEGQSLVFWLEDLNARRADIEAYMPTTRNVVTAYFIQPPMAKDGIGYSLHFDNSSVGHQKSVNDLGKITVNPLPYDFLTGIKLVKPDESSKQPNLLPVEKVDHPNPSLYIFELGIMNQELGVNNTLILSQAYHDGWRAYGIRKEGSGIRNWLNTYFPFIFGKELKGHVLVNNWENGWVIDSSEFSDQNLKFIVVFWPQYLEYLGFGLVLLIPLALFFQLRSKKA